MLPILVLLAGMMTAAGDSVATATVRLRSDTLSCTDPYAYFMSVGPHGPWRPDTTRTDSLTFIRESHHRLRVTFRSCERDRSLAIDVIETGSGDSRRVVARYRLSLMEILALPGLKGRIGGFSGESLTPEILWSSPRSFVIPTTLGTLCVEHLQGAEFTIAAHVRR